MNLNNKDLKPFYIYTDKNCLYIKNINEHTEKLANNIHSYCANIDNKKRIHICCIDFNGKLIHIMSHKNYWRKKVVYKVSNSVKNIKNMRVFIIDNFLNIFVVQQYPIAEDIYKVSHLNFNYKNYSVSRHNINNIYKYDESIYKLEIDSLSNIIFEYNSLDYSTKDLYNHLIVFNSESRSWIKPNRLFRTSEISDISCFDKPNIKHNLFEYCYSLNYKL